MVKSDSRPEFSSITSFEEFQRWYWYWAELVEICRTLGLPHTGNKVELDAELQRYFSQENGTSPSASVRHVSLPKPKRHSQKNNRPRELIYGKSESAKPPLQTPLLECGFAFNKRWRTFFANLTSTTPEQFHFTADMAATWKAVKRNHDITVTLADMLAIHEGTLTYVRYDASACQWNQFLKDFCADPSTARFGNKFQTAAMLWRIVRNSDSLKSYTSDLLKAHADILSTM